MLSIDPKYRKQEELGACRAMPELITELRLNTGNSCIEYEESGLPKNCPVQLDLLPLTPVADQAKAAAVAVDLPLGSRTNLRFLWQSHYSGSHTASTVECSEPDDQKVSTSAYSHPGSAIIRIDVNQIPADSTESEDPNTYSPASSTRSPFELNGIQIAERNYAKREREMEKPQELDDRTYEINSKGASDEEEGCNPRKKLRLSKEQSALLEESFREHSTLNPKQKQALAKQLCLRPRQVEVWFQNRRARTKLKQMEVDCELLKRCCENLTEENRRLQKELQELRAMKVTIPRVISQADSNMPLQHAATTYTLSMCPSCERLPTVGNTSHRFSNSGISTYTQSSAACS